jgi:hypothetical protein
MGMDVIGVAPATETGTHFRNNVWYWRPLWQYCEQIAPELVAGVSGQSNDGDGLDADGATQLAALLRAEIDSGRCTEFVSEFNRWKAGMSRTDCEWCDGTGVRSDPIGVANGMPDKVLDDATAILIGRSTGWCNGCNGEGQKDDWRLAYQFSVENVTEFVTFCENSGGFKIY